MSFYFRRNKAIGSKDKAFISENAYALIRWQGLLKKLSQSQDVKELFALLHSTGIEDLRSSESLKPHERVSFPFEVYQLLVNAYGPEKAESLCLISNQMAPTTVRANLLKTSREELIKKWEGIFQIAPCVEAKEGIRFLKKINFFTLSEFKEGLFEIQDEASQLLASLIQPKPKENVLDFCAGSGGKTLAFAPLMEGKGQIYLHDIRPRILLEAKKRLKRAGIQNAQIILPDDSRKLDRLKKKMDWVLIDVPCSGSGTYRRNPDMKWKFKEENFERLLQEQRSIFERALSFVKPYGKIVYTTCSLFSEENEMQLTLFLKRFPVKLACPIFKSLPTADGMDGMFGAVLERVEPHALKTPV